MHSTEHLPARRGFQRLWILETLIVAGVLAFAYVAMMAPASPPPVADRTTAAGFAR